jgi:regulator of protease activity HflC (stomatin/prohibitin superfamily)
MEIGLVITGVIAFLILIAVISGVRVVQEYERGVVFRLGRVLPRPKGPGLFLIIPYGIDRMVKVNLQTYTLDVPPQDVITRDNVTVKVDAVLYFKVVDPLRATVAIQNYWRATSQVAQTTLRAIVGKVDLDDLLGQRDQINDELARVIDDLTDPWGIKVELVEIKNVDLPDSMQRAMARQAEAERERRARIIAADGEFQASQKLSQAAEVMGQNPQALQLRFLQTVSEVSAERNSTLVMPIPVELLNFFSRAAGGGLLSAETAQEQARFNAEEALRAKERERGLGRREEAPAEVESGRRAVTRKPGAEPAGELPDGRDAEDVKGKLAAASEDGGVRASTRATRRSPRR